MKKRLWLAIAAITIMLTISAQALEPRTISAIPSLSFSGTTAYCSVICKGMSASDKIDVTLTLYQGKTALNSWSGSGTGRVDVYGEHEAISGKSYELVASYSVDGKLQPSVSTTNTCP